jgi:hypothetical protein
MYLDELRDELLDKRGVLVNPSTIYRALKKAGLSMKTVSVIALLSVY